jgi:hypothetical protein
MPNGKLILIHHALQVFTGEIDISKTGIWKQPKKIQQASLPRLPTPGETSSCCAILISITIQVPRPAAAYKAADCSPTQLRGIYPSSKANLSD